MRLALAIAGVLTVAAPQLARADSSGNEVIESCRRVAQMKKPRTDGDGLFMGECLGMVRTLVTTGSQYQTNMRFCAPGEATYLQATKVMVAWMDAHPQWLHELALILALDAFKETWPCKP